MFSYQLLMFYKYRVKCIFLTIVILTIFSNTIFCQKQFPKYYFRSPLDIPLNLSGNFAELRSNHFHSGIDIRTQGAIGKNIYATANGYVSRIKVSPTGYGKALYIAHPNGYTTVYGHLNEFSPKIDKYVRQKQYEKQKFKVTLYPMPELLKVKKGELIAKSGNTGSSGGPHLHYEIRETENDIPLNVLHFNLDIKDNVKPKVHSVVVYPMNDSSYVENKNKKIIYSNISNKTININGQIGFGVEANDYINSSRYKFGVFSIELKVDKKRIYFHQLNKFSFYESRYINSFIDYEERVKSRKRIQKCFLEPNNRLSIYKDVINKGIVKFLDNKKHKIELILKDVKGNQKKVTFFVKNKKQKIIKKVKKKKGFFFHYKKNNYIMYENIRITIYKNSLYKNIYLKYNEIKGYKETYSNVHRIHSSYTPLHYEMTISIKTNKLPEHLRNKALIARRRARGRYRSIGGKWIKGFVTAKTRYFGSYFIAVDTIAPSIKPVSEKKNNRYIKYIIKDEFSGIKSINGYIDNKWVLFEYDAKKSLIFCDIKKLKLKKGKHRLVLEISDYKNNIAKHKIIFNK